MGRPINVAILISREGCKMKNSPEDKERLLALAAFLPIVEADDFFAGETVFPPDTPDGVSRFPYSDLSRPVQQFLKMVYDAKWVVSFDWPAWARSQEAQDLFANDGRALSTAQPEQLRKMLTTCARRDRFCEGSLIADFESGLMQRIIRRADALLREQA